MKIKTAKILVGAHWGAMCHAPENTLAAFEKAIELGTYRIELDVRRCRGGQIVVVHDATVDRITGGTGRVADLSLDDLRLLRAGGTNETIPTLGEALRCCAPDRCRLLIEIEEAGMANECTISSFLEDELQWVLGITNCGRTDRST